MIRPFLIPSRSQLGRIGVLVGLIDFIGSMTCLFAADVPVENATPPPPPESRMSAYLDKVLPTAWQKRPTVQYNVITEMTPEGKNARVPTPDRPVYYLADRARFALTGWDVEKGDKPMPSAELEDAMRKALAGNGYFPAEAGQRPEMVVFIAYGTHATDPVALATGDEATGAHFADELIPFVVRDPSLFRDVVVRARFVAGDKFSSDLKAAIDGEIRNMRMNEANARVGSGSFAVHMPVSPEFSSPFDSFLRSGNLDRMRHFAELAFHTCYYVMASAYDSAAAEKGQKILLWRTRMTIEAQGLAMNETFKPLIANTAIYLGRETPEAVMVEKQFVRGTKVEVGTPEVVKEGKPVAAPAPENSGTP